MPSSFAFKVNLRRYNKGMIHRKPGGIPFKPPTKPGGFPTIMVEIPQMIVG
jgi:hypothetical protein